MKIEHLRLYISICELKSISKAADRAYLSQQSLSTMLKHMENELGMQLVYRTNRGIEMTEEGESFWQYCLRIVRLYDQFIEENKHNILSSEVVDLYATSSISRFFPVIFEKRFLGKYSLSINERTNEELRKYILQKKYGVILISVKESNLAGLKEMALGALHKVGFEDTSFYVCRQEEPIAHRALSTDQPEIWADKQMITLTSDLENEKGLRMKADKVLRVNNLEAYRKLIDSGQVIGVMPETLYYKYFADNQYRVLRKKKIEPLGYYLVCNLGKTVESKRLENELVAFFENAFSNKTL